MCGFIITKRDHTKVNSMNAINEMAYRGLRTKYRGYKPWKEYDLLHTALPMIDPDPDVAIQPIQAIKAPITNAILRVVHHASTP